MVLFYYINDKFSIHIIKIIKIQRRRINFIKFGSKPNIFQFLNISCIFYALSNLLDRRFHAR